MKAKKLIKTLLEVENKNSIVQIASDEEGNNFENVSFGLETIKLAKTGEKVLVLYPENSGKIMKIKELIKILLQLENNVLIHLSSDEEGNSYGDVSEIKVTNEKVILFPKGFYDYTETYECN